jgi:tape measure domain-containing protein
MSFNMAAILRIAANVTGTGDVQRLNSHLAQTGPTAQRSVPGVSALGRAVADVGKVAAGIGLANLTGRLGGFTRSAVVAGDETMRLDARIKTMATTTEEAARIQEFAGIYAKRFTLSQLEAGDAVSKAAARLRPLGLSLKEIESMMNGVSNAGRMMGMTSRDTAEVMRQLAQGIGSGAVAGDELRAILERMPPLAAAFAKAMNDIAKDKGLELITKQQAATMLKQIEQSEKDQTRKLKEGLDARNKQVEKAADEKLKLIRRKYGDELEALGDALDEQERLRREKSQEALDESLKRLGRQFREERRAIQRFREDQDEAIAESFEDLGGGYFRQEIGFNVFRVITEEQKKAIERGIEDRRQAEDDALSDREDEVRKSIQKQADEEARIKDKAAREERQKREQEITDRQDVEETIIRESLEKQKAALQKVFDEQVEMHRKANQEMIKDIKERTRVEVGDIKRLASEGRITPEVAKRVGPILENAKVPEATPIDRFNASMGDLSQTIGERLIPRIEYLIGFFERFEGFVSKIPDWAKDLGILAAAVGVTIGALKAAGAVGGFLRGGRGAPGAPGAPPGMGGPGGAQGPSGPISGGRIPSGVPGPAAPRWQFWRTQPPAQPSWAQMGPRGGLNLAPGGGGAGGLPSGVPSAPASGPAWARFSGAPGVGGASRLPSGVPTGAPAGTPAWARFSGAGSPAAAIDDIGKSARTSGNVVTWFAGKIVEAFRELGKIRFSGAGSPASAIDDVAKSGRTSGNVVTWFAGKAVEALKELGGVISGLRISATIAGWAGAIGPVVTTITGALQGLISWIGGTAVPTLAGFFSGPAGWAVLAGAGLVTAAFVWREPIREFMDYVAAENDNLASKIEPALTRVGDRVTETIAGSAESFRNMVEFESKAMDEFFGRLYEDFGKGIEAKIEEIKKKGFTEVLMNDIEFESKVWDKFFSNLYDDFGKGIEEKIGTLANGIGQAFGGAGEVIKNQLNYIIGICEDAFNNFIASANDRIAEVNRISSRIGIRLSPLQLLNVPRLARGGWTDRATTVVIGEGGDPGGEYAIPAQRMPAAIDAWNRGARGAELIRAMQSPGLAPGRSMATSGAGDGGAVAGGLRVTIRTGPVLQQPDGSQWVSLADVPAIVEAAARAARRTR